MGAESTRAKSTVVVGDILAVQVTKVTLGKDGNIYVTVAHLEATNRPTFIWKRTADQPSAH